MSKLKELIQRIVWDILKEKSDNLEELSATGTGASFTPGQGEQYATKYSFAKNTKKNKGTQQSNREGWKDVSDKVRHTAKTFDLEKWY